MLAELRFDGAPVVVTGAGSGIGRATCEVLAELGAALVLVGRNKAALDETAALLTPYGAETLVLDADVSKEDDVARARDAVATRWPRVKGLVNNAGNNFRTAAGELSTAKWNELIGVNLTGTFFMTRAFLPLLEAEGRASVVNVASIFGLIGPPEMPVYAAAKGGVIALTRQLAIDYGPRGIRINAIAPGPILTERVKGYYADGKRDIRDVADAVALRRMGEPREVANAIAFMASDAASYLHGATVVLDGGRTIR